MSRILFLIVLTSLILTAGANPATAPARRPAAAANAPQLSDAQIERDLRDRYAKSKMAAKKFTFRVQGGVVTIEGKADVIQHKGAMTRMARTSGARAVVNRIEISEAARAKAAARLDASRQRAAIKRDPVAPRSPK